VGSNTGSKIKTKQATGKTGRITGLEEGEQNLGNRRQGAATGPNVAAAEAATELTGQPCEVVTGLDVTAGETATEATEQLERTDETATEATGQLDWTAGTAAELAGLTAGTEPQPGKKKGEDRSAKSTRGRDKYGRRGKQSGSQTYLGASISARPYVEVATDEDGRVDKTDETAHGADSMVGRDNNETA